MTTTLPLWLKRRWRQYKWEELASKKAHFIDIEFKYIIFILRDSRFLSPFSHSKL